MCVCVCVSSLDSWTPWPSIVRNAVEQWGERPGRLPRRGRGASTTPSYDRYDFCRAVASAFLSRVLKPRGGGVSLEFPKEEVADEQKESFRVAVRWNGHRLTMKCQVDDEFPKPKEGSFSL